MQKKGRNLILICVKSTDSKGHSVNGFKRIKYEKEEEEKVELEGNEMDIVMNDTLNM